MIYQYTTTYPHQFLKVIFFWTKTPTFGKPTWFFLTAKKPIFFTSKKKQKIIDYMKLKKTESTRVALSCSKQDNEFIMAKLCLFFKFWISIDPTKIFFECVKESNIPTLYPGWKKYIYQWDFILKNLGGKLKLILSKIKIQINKTRNKNLNAMKNDYFAWMK